MPIPMMAPNNPTVIPAYVGNGGFADTGAGSTSQALSVPAGVQPGDLLIAAWCNYYNQSFTAPAGWTARWGETIGQGQIDVLTHVVALGDPSSFTWTYSNTYGQTGGVIVAYRRVTSTPDVEAQTSVGNVSSLTTPSVTTTKANDLVVLILGNNIQNGGVTSVPGGVNVRNAPVGGGGAYPLGIYDFAQAAPASGVGAQTFGVTANAGGWAAFTIALQPS